VRRRRGPRTSEREQRKRRNGNHLNYNAFHLRMSSYVFIGGSKVFLRLRGARSRSNAGANGASEVCDARSVADRRPRSRARVGRAAANQRLSLG
jgi:hypothetical protein